MLEGLTGALLWALDTVILGIALAMTPFTSTQQAVFLAPFVSTFLHDFCSSVWMLLYMGIRRQLKGVWKALKTRSGKFIILGALLGGPVGMSGYVAAIKYVGPATTAVISALYPALGALLARLFLKERMSGRQIAGLVVSILGVIGLEMAPSGGAENIAVGITCALVCVLGWASEAVICAYGMKDPDVKEEQALQIRQITSAIVYGVVILPVLPGWDFTLSLIPTGAIRVVAAAALAGTASYILYYRAIRKIGSAKAMALNITYTAWAIFLSALFLHIKPEVKSLVCAGMVVCGSLAAAAGKKRKLNGMG